MMLANLELKETNITKKTVTTIFDLQIEARSNHNELVLAINAINECLNGITAKLDNAKMVDYPNIDLKNAVDFNQVAVEEVKTKLLPALEVQMNANMNKVKADLTIKVDGNSDKIVAQEGHSRRKNLIISGVRELHNETTEEVVRDFFTDKLLLDEEDTANYIFRDVHRLPRSKKAPADSPRPIIVAFVQQKDRNAVIRNAFNLKGTDFSMKTDLPKALNDLRGRMLERRKKLKEDNPTIWYRIAEIGYKPVLMMSDSFIDGSQDRRKWVDMKFK